MFHFNFAQHVQTHGTEKQLLDARDRLAAAQECVARRQCSEATVEYARKCVNPYELLQHVDVSGTPHSRSYFKLLEIASYFPAVVAAAQKCTLHLCEAPGGFIDATLDMSNGTAEWHASSLAQRECIPFHDHHLRAKKINGHSRVIFGSDGSGNILLRDNATCVIHESGNGRCSLVTADGSVDDSGANRDETHARLIAAQTYVALQTLQPGSGCFVLRVLDCFMPSARNVLWMCHALFEHSSLVKLCASRVCESERYLVCTGFRATPSQLRTCLDLLDSVAFGGAELASPSAPSPDAEAALCAALVAMTDMQTVGVQDSTALAVFLHSTGVATARDTRQHYNEHLTRNDDKVMHARQLMAGFPSRANRKY